MIEIKRIIGTMALVLVVSALFSQEFVKLKIGTNQSDCAAYSPDRLYLAINDGSDILIYTAGTTTVVKRIKVLKSIILTLEYLDKETLLVTTRDKSVSIVNTASGTITARYKSEDDILKAMAVTDKRVAFITEKKVAVYDFQDQKMVFEKSDHTKPIRALAVSQERKIMASGAGDGKIVIYNSDNGELLLNKKVHEGWVRSLDFNPDGTLIASGDDNGELFISSASGELTAKYSDAKGWINSVRFSNDGKYIALGDEKGNCFIYSIENKILSQRIEEMKYPLSSLQFRNDGKELAVVEDMKGVRVLDVSELKISPVFKVKDNKDINPPQILVSNPPNIQNDRYRYSQDHISIKGIVIDDSGVRSLRINGIETPLKDNGNFVLYLPLAMGDNSVSIEALDINDNLAVKRFSITRKGLDGEEYDITKAKNYLFVVGINDYEHWPKLNNAVRDANDITSTLMGLYRFDFENIILLKNEQATRSNIYKSLRSLVEKITPQDNLVIYYSGHGYYDELLNEGYWVPVEGRPGSSGDYLSNSDILKIIGTINSQHTFLVADACFSGSLFSDSKRGYDENVEKFKSRWGLASGRLEVVSDGSLDENSPFTSTVIEFLKDSKKDKFPVSELIQYVKVKVAEKAAQTPLGNPLKGAGDEGGEFIFYKKN